MTKITVNRLSTSNTMPTITGTVEFERIKSLGNTTKTQTIHVIVNYNRYKLFDGNLGLDESKTPNVWKLQFDTPLYPGTYDIEAQVIDVDTNLVLASDNTIDELIIFKTYPTSASSSSSNMTVLQKLQLVQGLMKSLNKLFGGQNGIGQNPSVHPNQDDQISTSLIGRGAQEGDNDPRRKGKVARQKKMVVPVPVPRPDEFKSTKPAGAAAALAKAQEALGGGSGLDSTVDPAASQIDETEKILAEAQAKTDAMNETFDAAVEANGGDMTKTLIEQNPGDQNVTPTSPLG
jgi:hypothetical protein